MVKNFEELTESLTKKEIEALPLLEWVLVFATKDAPLKAPKIVKMMVKKGAVSFNQVTLRKMVNHFRKNGIIPVIATKSGYYTSYENKDISSQIDSLVERAKSILDCADGLQKLLK